MAGVNGMRVLLIEDDPELVRALKLHLSSAGFAVDDCQNGRDAAYYLANGGYNAVILDRLLPDKDGLTILKEMRASGNATPTLMLTALDTVKDRTDGLDAGADDYLVKPFAVAELISRVRALTRRPAAMLETETLRFGKLAFDARQGALTGGGHTQTLSRKEAAVLELFFENPNRVLSRAEILARGWGGDEAVEEGNVDNYIYFLRRRLKGAGGSVSIRTVHGLGYQLVEEDR